MRKSTRMKQFIKAMEKKHNLDFSIPGTWLKLDGGVYMDLTIECTRPNKITITHYYTQMGDLIPDPDVEILVGCDGEFYPFTITHSPPFNQYRVYATVDFDRGTFVTVKPRGQADLARFVNTWATNLGRQGFREADAKRKEQGGK